MKIGKVYKIICTQSNDVYVGSTFNTLRDRWRDHKNSFKDSLNKKNMECSIYPYFKQYGIENFKIILIKEYNVYDRKELLVYETLWVCKLKSINKLYPFSIKTLKNKQYRKDNKEQILEKGKQHYQQNKERILEQHKQNYEKNKDKYQEKFNCDCGGKYTFKNKLTHIKTKKHLNYISNNIPLY
jgi:hypothetical protein